MLCKNTHPAIVSKYLFNIVQEEIKRCERVVRNNYGSIVASKSKCYLLCKYVIICM